MPARPQKSLKQGNKEITGYVHREHRSKKGRKRKSFKFVDMKGRKDEIRKAQMDYQEKELKRGNLIKLI